MRFISLFIFCVVMVSCSKIETASNNVQIKVANSAVSPIVPEPVLLKPVKPNIKLNAKQQKDLDESLPPQVREVLEKAETFEILADVNTKPTESSSSPSPISISCGGYQSGQSGKKLRPRATGKKWKPPRPTTPGTCAVFATTSTSWEGSYGANFNRKPSPSARSN